jgi:Ribosomal L27e protein family
LDVAFVVVQTFVKIVNYQHMMPTRYTLDVDLKSVVSADSVDNSSKRKEASKVTFMSLGLSHHLAELPVCPWKMREVAAQVVNFQ